MATKRKKGGSAARWREGFSKTSTGRFGGFRDDVIPYNSGYLTANATATRVYLQTGDATEELGWYQLPADFCQRTETTWVSNRYVFSFPDGRPHSAVTRSLLYPGFHHAVRTRAFDYYFRVRGYGPSVMALPLAGGISQIIPGDGYDRKRDGELAKPWILLYWCDSGMPFDYPMLVTFSRRPQSIEFISHEYMKIRFGAKNATVIQAHPCGAERLDKDVTRKWRDSLPPDLAEKCDLLARAALAYPHRCREFFRIDEARRVVEIRNEFKYLESKSDWGIEPLHLAPLPPLVANLRNAGHPVEVKGEVFERICPTFSGWYEAVRGRELEYELPLSRFRNMTLAPVAIRNNPVAEDVTGRLTEYLESGDYLTFGGDDDYDPECSLDSLHDLRIMAWAAHSAPEQRREGIFKLLSRGLRAFGEEAYLEYSSTGAGIPWVRDAGIFANRGVVDYDFEWYNGMNLAGLWAYSYFARGGEGLDIARENWDLVRKIFGYVDGYADWVVLGSWTCARGESMWLDGINYMYEGALGYAALARKLGRRREAEWADYCTAKLEAFLCNCWTAGDYCAEHFPQEGGAEALCAAGYWEGRPTGYGDATGWSCGIFGYCVREILVLLKDLGLEKRIGKSFEKFSGAYPEWKENPYPYGKGSGYPGFDERRTIHHYFLDPRLMVAAVVLGESVEAILNSGGPLTGPVLECLLVSMAPMLLVPRDVEFIGSVWDDGAKTLAVTLAGEGRAALAFAHSGTPEVVSGPVVGVKGSEGRVEFTAQLDGETELVFRWDSWR